jgi:hypothetical protein
VIARAAVTLFCIALVTAAFTHLAAQQPAPGAPLDLAGFKYSRSVPAGSGLTTVVLDAAALAHGRLDDIRIIDRQRRQIPYLLERGDSTLLLPLPALATVQPATNIDRRLPADAARQTWYRARVAYAGVPDATLRLETSARVFRRTVTVVEGVPLDATSPRVTTDSWSHDDPGAAASPLDISLPARLRSDSLFVLVNDGDNERLPITSATLRIPTYRLRFFQDSAEALRVVYGRADLGAPRYDLELLAERLRDSAATLVALGPESAIDDAAGRVPGRVFWGVLVGTVLILLALIARLVRGGDSDAPAATVSSPPPHSEPPPPSPAP